MNNPYWISPHEVLQLWFINIVYPLRMTKEGREGLKESFADFAAVFRFVTQRSSTKTVAFFRTQSRTQSLLTFWSAEQNQQLLLNLFFLIGRQKHEGGPTSVVRQEVDRPWDPTNQSASFVGILAKICGEIFYFRCFSWNFNSSLKFLECYILLSVWLSLKITVLFTFVRSLKRISTWKP